MLLQSFARDASGQFDLEIIYWHCSFVPLCFVLSICGFERHRHELSLRPNPHISNLNSFLFSSIFCSSRWRFLCSWRRFFTCTPHPYHFPSSSLHGFLVARAKSRSTLFIQAALQSKFCSYFISPCLFRSLNDQTSARS